MTQNRKELYNLESQYINCFHKDNEKQKIILKINEVLLKITPDFADKNLKSIYDLFEIITKIHFNSNFLSEIVIISQEELSNKVTEKEILFARQYVEKLLNVDLSSVNVEYIENNLMDNIEGECIACKKDKHQIFYQKDENGVISTDLIIHEFGHAADFTISRTIDDDDLLNRHISISESIAYYCQYKFLMEFGTKKQRQGSFGAFILTYLSIIICKYCLANDVELHNLNNDDIILDDSIQEMIKSYQGRVSNSFIIDRINMIKNMHENLLFLLTHEILPRFGMIFALFLLDKDENFINELIKKNSINNSLENFISEIIPNQQDDILNLESKFSSYFNS